MLMEFMKWGDGMSKKKSKYKGYKTDTEYKREWREKSKKGKLSDARSKYKFYFKKYLEVLDELRNDTDLLTEEDLKFMRKQGLLEE